MKKAKNTQLSYKTLNTDTRDRREENSRQHNKWCGDVGNNVTHLTVTLLLHANYIILIVITIVNIACRTTLTTNYYTSQFIV